MNQPNASVDSLLSRWHTLCEQLTLAANDREGRELLGAYREPQRAYHTVQHLAECFARLDEAADAIASDENIAIENAAGWIEYALWYHDAIYKPRAKNNANEAYSARWADQFLQQAGADMGADALATVRARVDALIMCTCHERSPADALQAWMIDIDLSILGADPERFAEYDRQVRREYRWVPWFLYRRKRRELLQTFLQRPRLYATDFFYQRLEQQARDNLSAVVQQLTKA